MGLPRYDLSSHCSSADEAVRSLAWDHCAHLAAIVESSSDAIVGADLNGTIVSWNRGAQSMFGYSTHDMVGSSIERLIPDEMRQEEHAYLQKMRLGNACANFETLRQVSNGGLIDVSIALSPIFDREGCLVGVSRVMRDITELKRSMQGMARKSQLYAVLNQVGQMVRRAPTREEICLQGCRMLVEQGGFEFAWIGGGSERNPCLTAPSICGDDLGYLQSLAGGPALERSPHDEALHQGSPVLCNELDCGPQAPFWALELIRRGYVTCAAFPMRVQGVVCGALSVYSRIRDRFHAAEVALLSEVANNISLALDNFALDEANRHAEQAMRDEMRFSTMMLESMPGIVYFYDTSGRFLRWNRNFEFISGYEHREIAEMQPLDFFSASDRLRLAQAIADVFSRGESSVEAEFLSKDGRLTPYFFTGKLVEFQGMKCLVGVGIDISERQRAVGALREAEARFHMLFKHTPVGVVVIDPETISIIEFNEQAARQLGYLPDEFTGISIAQIDAMEQPGDIRARLQAVRQNGQMQFETRHRTKLGEIRDVFVTGRPVELGGRKVIHCVQLDITERKRAEALLRESEARLVEAQRIAGIGDWELDLDGQQVNGSRQACEIFGLCEAELPLSCREFLAFVHPDDRMRLQDAQRATLAGVGRLDIEHRIVLRDGSEKIVHVLANTQWDEASRAFAMAGTVHDISVRVRLEAEREARHRAEAADRIKSAFLATMSHELRTPLNSIIGFTSIILQGLAGPVNDEQSKQLGMVRASGRHLLALVNDVLDISKIEAGQITLASRAFDLAHSIQKAIALVMPQANAKRLHLEQQIPADLGEALGDERRFEQILLNLLSNAVKFTDQGQVTLRARLLPGNSPPAVHISVADSGMGIKPEHLPHLFQPFRQIDAGLDRVHEGTGLGLAISHRLANLMGGEISVESVWGKGSVFSVTLPLQRTWSS